MEQQIEPEPRHERDGPERDRALRPSEEGPSSAVVSAAEERLIRLMEEFRRRQRKCPDLVVRPWWTPLDEGGAEPGGGSVGFVVEYCPSGVETAELAVRLQRVRVEGPGGLREARLDLATGWSLDGEDRVCQETLANYLLRMADQLLESEAA